MNVLRREGEVEKDSEFWEISSFVAKCIKVLKKKRQKNVVYNIISIDLPWENFASFSHFNEMFHLNLKFFASAARLLYLSLSFTPME